MAKRKLYYHRRHHYSNPFFPRSQRSIFTWQAKVILGLILLILGFLGYLIFYSKLFEITKIEILGNKKIPQAALEKLVNEQSKESKFLFLKQSNLFLFNKDQLNQKFNEEYLLEKLKITKRPFHRLKIEIEEKTSILTWVSGGHYYYLDLRGLAIEEIPQFIKLEEKIENLKEEENGEIKPKEEKINEEILGEETVGETINPIGITVVDETNQEVILGEKIASEEMINFVIKLNEELPLKTKIRINYFKIKEKENKEIVVLTEEGWEIYFNYNLELNKQVKNLILLLNEKIKDETQGLQYIDLRWGERVYYK